MDHNESILWSSFKKGDQNALFSIYEFLYPDLIKNGLSVTSDAELVKDTINQFFLYLWDKRENLSIPNNLQYYIIISFKRRLIAEIKDHRRTDQLVIYDSLAEESPEEILIKIQTDLEFQLKVRRAIEKLSKRQRELILLKYYEGLSYEEIEQKTCLSRRTIYNKLHEAIKYLKKDLLVLLYLLMIP